MYFAFSSGDIGWSAIHRHSSVFGNRLPAWQSLKTDRSWLKRIKNWPRCCLVNFVI